MDAKKHSHSTFQRYQDWSHQINSNFSNYSQKLDPSHSEDPEQEILFLPQKDIASARSRRIKVYLFNQSVEQKNPNRNQSLRISYSKQRIIQANKKCRELRSKNQIKLKNTTKLNQQLNFTSRPIHAGKQSRNSFTNYRNLKDKRAENNNVQNNFQQILTILSKTPSHYANRGQLIRQLSSYGNRKYSIQNKAGTSQTFRSSIKPKKTDDNPKLFANILKKKASNMQSRQIKKHIVQLARKLNL